MTDVNWADELDIDIDALMLEKFHTPSHYRLLRKHNRRVAKYQQHNRWVAFVGHLDEVGQKWREIEDLRRARIRAAKRPREYDFSDELVQIAVDSLDAKDSM